ncbi:MAG: radical SAM protein [Candidatus Methanofastidiosia archaeon]
MRSVVLAIKWDPTYRCNLHCRHCSNAPERKGKKDLSEQEMKRLVARLSSAPLLGRVQLLGGEPTLRSDFHFIVKSLGDAGIKVGVNSNGLRSKTLEKSIEYLDEINISLESAFKEIHENIRGKNTFERTTSTLRRISDLKAENNYKTRLVISTVLNKINVSSLPELIKIVDENRIDQWIILQLIEEGNACSHSDVLGISSEETACFTKNLAKKIEEMNIGTDVEIIPRYTYPLLIEWVNENFNTSLQIPVHGCGAGITFAYLNQRGELFPCDRMTPQYTRCPFSEMIVPKSLLDFDFFEIWSSWEFDKAFELQMDKKTYKNYHPCEECRYLGKECFPCPVYYRERNVLMNDCSEIWGKINEES